MDWNQYQEWAVEGVLESTRIPDHPLVYPAMGLAGEAGEYVDKIKKSIRDGELDKTACAKELGDVLWYLAVSAHELGFTLNAIQNMNVVKLNNRRANNTVKGSGDDR